MSSSNNTTHVNISGPVGTSNVVVFHNDGRVATSPSSGVPVVVTTGRATQVVAVHGTVTNGPVFDNPS